MDDVNRRTRHQFVELLADLRALGLGAPVRICYEVAKRIGVIGALLRCVAVLPSRRSWPPRIVVPSEAYDVVLASANDIVDLGGEIFFRRVPIPTTSSQWLTGADGQVWPSSWWWKISTQRQPPGADIKFVWEPARHDALVTLARAASLDPQHRARCLLNDSLSAFLDIPTEQGPHWASNLEVSLRALNWQQILELSPDVLDPEIRRRLNRELVHAIRHIVVDLPYTLSSTHNNHLIGDATCLAVLGGAVTSRFGGWLLRRAARNQVAADGSTADRSPAYSRFVLELLRRASSSVDTDAESLRIASFLARVGLRDGSCPNIGDSDHARAIVPVGGGQSLVQTLESSAVLAMYEMSPLKIPSTCPEADGGDHGGIAVCSEGPMTSWVVAGWGVSHAHADLGSVSLRHRSKWIVVDPGTGAYAGDRKMRRHLRSSRSHSILEIDGRDQVRPRRAFGWHSAPTVGFVGRGRIQFVDGTDLVWVASYHRAFEAIGIPVVVRVVLTAASHCSVVDLVAPGRAASKPTVSRVVLHPDVTVHLGGAQQFVADLSWASSTVPSLDCGWFSPHYGSVVPTKVLEVQGSTEEVSWWTIGVEIPAITTNRLSLLIDEVAIELWTNKDSEVLVVASREFPIPGAG